MTHRYSAQVAWQHEPGQDFAAGHYSRRHVLRYDGGVEVAGSSSPQVVPLPWSHAAAVDPEEAFVAALSACHLLWFLALAAKERYVVERYVDDAEGTMARNAEGKLAMTMVTLRPRVAFGGERRPTREQFEQLHHRAHEECFIANSVKTDVRCEPVIAA